MSTTEEKAQKILPHLLQRELTSQDIIEIIAEGRLKTNDIPNIMECLCQQGYLVYEDNINKICNVYGIMKR